MPLFQHEIRGWRQLARGRADTARRSRARCVRLMAKVARAVQYAHEHGVFCIAISSRETSCSMRRGEPLVTRLRLAKWLDTITDLTRTLTIFGTPGYIAPEQARGSAYTTHVCGRCLQPRRDPVRSLYRSATIPGRTRARRDPASLGERSAETAFACARGRSRSGNNLRQMPRAGAEGSISICRRSGRRSGTLARGTADRCPACPATYSRLALGEAEPRTGFCHDCSFGIWNRCRVFVFLHTTRSHRLRLPIKASPYCHSRI